ncbi:MAG: DUF2142 domain-containing protein [Acidimicrobiales bacterium]|jgi:hypothetical protein
MADRYTATKPSEAPGDVVADGPFPAPTAPGAAVVPPRRRRVRYLLTLLAVCVVVACWTFATPLMAAPDEPSQIGQAAAIVRGQFDVPPRNTPIGKLSYVHVPEWIARSFFLLDCFAFKPSHSAACGVSIGDSTRTATIRTQFSNYPPFYFLWVGIPTLFMKGTRALYVMRLVSGLVNCVLLALGICLLYRYHPRRLPLVGALVAVTPMVLFMASVVNASGLEISAAFASWCAGLCVIEYPEPPRTLVVWTSIAFAIFICSRPISPANAAIVLCVLAATAGWSRICSLARAHGTRVIGMAILVALIVAGVLLLIGGPPSLLGGGTKPPLTFWESFHLVLTQDPGDLRQAIGLFGWTDTPIPGWVATVWTAMAGTLCVVGLIGSARSRRAIPLLVLAVLAMPVVFEIPKINSVGAYWQGRYWLPLLVGIPLVAAALQPPRPHRRPRIRLAPNTELATRLVAMTALGALIVGAQVATFVLALRRYTTGLGVPPGTPARWAPPGGTTLVIGLFVVGEILLVATIGWQSVRPGAPLRRLTRS